MSKNDQAENLASRILTELDAALCVKLKERKAEIEELRDYFKDLKGKETIAGCKTWAEFCEKKLHRTDRAVRKMLAAPKPSKAKEQQSSAEQSSADAVAGEDPCDALTENTHEAPDEEKEDESKKHGENRSRACKALREFLGSVPDEDMLTNLLRVMFPDYLVTVNITSLPFAIEQNDGAEQEVTQ